MEREPVTLALSNNWRLFLVLQLDHYDLDWFVACVDVGMLGIGRICRQPIRFTGLPDMLLAGTACSTIFMVPPLSAMITRGCSWRCMVSGAFGMTTDFQTLTSSSQIARCAAFDWPPVASA